MNAISLVLFLLVRGTEWTCLAGGLLDDGLEGVEEAPGGEIIVAGRSIDPEDGSIDGWLLCISPLMGVQQWEKRIGGPEEDYFRAVAVSSDGAIYAVGVTDNNSTDKDLWVVKLDACGRILWQKTFGGDLEDVGTCVAARPEGGAYVGGYTWSMGSGGCDMWVLALDENGNECWSHTIGGQAQDMALCLTVTSQGYVILGGMTSSYQSEGIDTFLAALDSTGMELWRGYWGGALYDYGTDLLPLTDGGVLAVSWSKQNTCAVMVLDVSSNGTLRDSLLFSSFDDLRAEGIEWTGNGWCIAGTCQNPTSGDKDFFVLGLDAEMDRLWQETLGGTFDEICESMIYTSAGRLVLVGRSSTERGDTDGWAVCMDPAVNPR